MKKKKTNRLPDDLKDIFDIPSEPSDLSSDWFVELQKFEVSEDELTAWLRSLEDKGE
jgi:hypothetical protein